MRHMGPAAGVSSPGSQGANRPRVPVLSYCFIKSPTGGFNEAGSELKILPAAAHLSNIEQADEFNKAMTGFLNRVA